MNNDSNSKDINWDKLDALLQFKCTREYAAEYIGVSQSTMVNKLKKIKGKTFEEYREHCMQGVSVKLQQKAIEMALGGHAVMMIFSLKNISKWADKQETLHEVATSVEEFIKRSKKTKSE